jgi:acyl dehydratase
MMPVAIGARFAKSVTLDAASIRRFATLAGDMNPLHHDDAASARGPFGRLIASGTQLAALMMGLDATHFSAFATALGLGFEFKFVKAVPAGTTLSIEWTVTRVEHKPSLAGWIVALDGTMRDTAGELYVSARGSNLLRPLATGAAQAAAS